MFQKINFFSLAKIIIKILIVSFIYFKFLHSDFKPIYYHIIKKHKLKSNVLEYISEMYDNLTIYREKYIKNGNETRYFKNGDLYNGSFNNGFYKEGIYYKNRNNMILNPSPINILKTIFKMNNPFGYSKYLLFYGKFKNVFFDEGIYFDEKNGVIYKGKYENNKANGKGNLYFKTDCFIEGIFEENILKKITSYNCIDKNFCDKYLYLEINIEKIEINEDVDWNQTLHSKKNICFLFDIIIPILWILYILLIRVIMDNFLKCLMNLRKKYINKKSKNSKYFPKEIIRNELSLSSLETIDINDSIKYDDKSINTIYNIEYNSSKGTVHGTGFFCKIKLVDINLEMICFLTNYHVLENILIEPNINKIELFNNKKEKKIEIEINKRIIMLYSDKLDYFCIEANNKTDEYLEVDPSIFNKNYLNTSIFISGFQENKTSLIKGNGEITELDKKYNFIFYHNINTEKGCSGSPACNYNSYVIGIHRGYNKEKKKNTGTFLNFILQDIRKKYIKLIIQNQPIFSNQIGYFCQIKNINCKFLIIKYKTYIDFVLNKKLLYYDTILSNNNTINLNFKRFIFSCKEYNFCILELKEDDKINHFFNFLEIEEQINLIKEKKLTEISVNENMKDFNKFEIIQKEDFFDSIKNYGNNLYQKFIGINKFPKEEKYMNKCYLNAQNKLNNFMEQLIQNLIYKIEVKKYFPKFNYLKFFIQILFCFIGLLLLLPHAIRFFKNNLKEEKEKYKNKIYNFLNKEKNKFARYEILNNSNLRESNIILHIKKGAFNKIDLDSNQRKQINYISIEKGSKIFGDCSELFRLFENCKNIEIENLDTSQVTNMGHIFEYNKGLKNLNLSNFVTSNTENMTFMFHYCENLVSLDLSNFNTSKVKYMDSMFHKCDKLQKLNISSLDTKNVISMNLMFSGIGMKILNLSNFDTSNVINMKGMFKFTNFKYIDLSSFNTSKVVFMEFMFMGNEFLKKLNLSNFDTSNVENMQDMFNSCTSLKELNLSNFNTSKVNNMKGMFHGCESLSEINLVNFDTSKVISMEFMFSSCKSIKILKLSNFNTRNVISMLSMFGNCESLIYIDISSFNTSNVITMKKMFYSCLSLRKLNISNFNTSKVENMRSMFANCESLKELKLNNFNTKNVKSMKHMFYACVSLKVLEINNFNTTNVIDMSKMFGLLTNLAYLNISNFYTPNVKNMERLFAYCSSLKKLDLSNFVIRPDACYDSIFNETDSSLIIITNKNNKYIIDIFNDYQKQKEKGKEKNFLKIISKVLDDFIPDF